MSMNNIPQSTTLSNTTAGTSCFDANHIDVTTIEDLEQVGSDKWTRYPGCIGAFIAEMDYGLAPCVAEAIEEATERGALGYIPDPWKKEVARSCAAWQRRYGWEVDPTCIRPVPDVLEIVRAGNSIVVPTPAYMPFLSVPRLYGVEVLEIPMLCAGAGESSGRNDEWLFDFDAIEQAFANGCHAFVLCNPHNPIGKVLTREEMLRLSDLAAKYDVRLPRPHACAIRLNQPADGHAGFHLHFSLEVVQHSRHQVRAGDSHQSGRSGTMDEERGMVRAPDGHHRCHSHHCGL